MITRTIGNKIYKLEKLDYNVVAGAETMYLGFEITEDLEFGTRTYKAGMNVSSGNLELVLQMLEGGFADLTMQAVLEEKL